MKCLNQTCYSPVACNGFGYCRELNFKRSGLDAVVSSGITHERSRLECPTCLARKPGEMMPPHKASDRCESGKYNHCTCDICF